MRFSSPISRAFLLSCGLHALLLAGATMRFSQRPDQATPVMEIRLTKPPSPPAQTQKALAESTTTEAAAVAPAPTPAAPAPSRGRPLQRAQAALSRHLLYPPEAVEQGLEGTVILLLALDAGGRVGSVEVARSSGHALLDRAAVAAARQIGALPGNPRQSLLPVRFQLN